MRVILVLTLTLLSGGIAYGETPPYYNSSDVSCNPNDPTVLFCEGFETPNPGAAPCNKRWGQYADLLVPPGDFDGCAKGWGMHFTCPSTYPECVQAGATPFGTYAGNFTQGPKSGGSGADHGFAPSMQPVTEVYYRYYQWFSPNYTWAQLKLNNPNSVGPNGSGIKWGNLHANCGGSPGAGIGLLQWQNVAPEDTDTCQDLNYLITRGVWHFFEIHIKLSTNATTADGVLEVWADDCGVTGLSCKGRPTLRYSRSNMRFPRNDSTEKIKVIWWEMWCNACTGESQIDEILVKTFGPIGFAGTGPPPGPPTGLSVIY